MYKRSTKLLETQSFGGSKYETELKKKLEPT